MDNYAQIMELCDIVYRESSLFYGAIDIGNNFYLANGTDKTWGLSCPADDLSTDTTTPVRSCVNSIISIPCRCKLTSSKWFVPARLTGCDTQLSQASYLHHLNLPVLHALFPLTVQSQIGGQDSSPHEHIIELPQLNVIKDKRAKVAAKETKAALDFKMLARHVNRQVTLYASKADSLLDTMMETTPTMPYLA
jgi:hypothetical protein